MRILFIAEIHVKEKLLHRGVLLIWIIMVNSTLDPMLSLHSEAKESL